MKQYTWILKLNAWLQRRKDRRAVKRWIKSDSHYRAWKKRSRVIMPAPNPRAIVYRRWNVPL